jgi:hypothetical protein
VSVVAFDLQTIATSFRFHSVLRQEFAKFLLMVLQQRLFEKRSVHEILWGYHLTYPPYVPPLVAQMLDELIQDRNGNSSEFGVYVGVS